MKKICFLLLLILPWQISGYGQKKELNISDAVIGQWRQLYPEYLRSVAWRANSHYFTYVKGKEILQEGIKNEEPKVLLDLDGLNRLMSESNFDSLRYVPNIEWKEFNEFSFSYGGTKYKIDLDKNKATKEVVLPQGENFTKNDNNVYAYTVDSNIFILYPDGRTEQITKDGKYGLAYGMSVHRNEFGINGGLFWSPKGNKLAFYRMDESMVSDYPLVDVNSRIAEVHMIKYPMAGMTSHQVTIGVYDLENKSFTYLKTGEPKDQYLTCVSWSPDEKSIYTGILNREQNYLKMNEYNAESGEFIKTLFEERNDKYVEPEHALIFMKNNPKEFIYQSRRDGYSHLYLYSSEGKLIRRLTSGNWEVTSFLGFDNTGNYAYIESTKESPIERHVYRLNLKNSKLQRLTFDKGTHSVTLSSDGKYFIDKYSSTTVPNCYKLSNKKGNSIRTILEASNPLSDYQIGEMSIFKIKAADGETDLYARMIKPYNFDPDKKYPAIVYVYGGPHAQLVTDTWLGGARMWQYYMAQKGYVMLTVDNRGSANRGLEFENVIHRQVGQVEMKDQMQGIAYLQSLGYVDTSRIGVHGWSYGGFMTTSLMTNYPDVFKVGVAGGPVIDWKFYEVMYGERYMDTPQENPDGYKKTSLLNSAKNLKGKLLIIHGAQDPTVVWQNSQCFLNECIKNNVQVDYFIYPDHEHNVRGYDRIHLMDKVSRYFDDYLK